MSATNMVPSSDKSLVKFKNFMICNLLCRTNVKRFRSGKCSVFTTQTTEDRLHRIFPTGLYIKLHLLSALSGKSLEVESSDRVI